MIGYGRQCYQTCAKSLWNWHFARLSVQELTKLNTLLGRASVCSTKPLETSISPILCLAELLNSPELPCFARPMLRTHSTCKVEVGWAFENTIVPHLSFPRNFKTQWMLCSGGLGLRKRRQKRYVFDDRFENTGKHCQYNASLGGTFEIIINSMLCWAGCSKTQHTICFPLLSLRKPNIATTLTFLSKSQKTVDATLGWDGPPKSLQLKSFAKLSHRKHNSSHLSFLWSFKRH